MFAGPFLGIWFYYSGEAKLLCHFRQGNISRADSELGREVQVRGLDRVEHGPNTPDDPNVLRGFRLFAV
jgi:hypothetical protein